MIVQRAGLAAVVTALLLAGCVDGPTEESRKRVTIFFENADAEAYRAALPLADNATGRPLLQVYPFLPASSPLTQVVVFYADAPVALSVALTRVNETDMTAPAQEFVVPVDRPGPSDWTRVAFRVEGGRVVAHDVGDCPLGLDPCGGPD